MPFWICGKLSFVFFFSKKWMEPTNSDKLDPTWEKRLKSTCPRKRCQTLPEMILVFWCVESILADYNMRLTTFFWWLQDWNLLSHRCKSSCWKRPRCTISLQHELLACLETPETVLVVCVCALVSCKMLSGICFTSTKMHSDFITITIVNPMRLIKQTFW